MAKGNITQKVKYVGPSYPTMSTKVTLKHPAKCQCATCVNQGKKK